MVSTFSYEALPARSIRVIKLSPALHVEDPLKCSIRTVSLDHAKTESYEALSYVWGEPTRQWPMDCDGTRLLVTKNCHEALINLRRKFVPRVLWIDAICINQGDDDDATKERNAQVKMMGEVYLKAKRVLIWLGMGNASTSILFRYLPIFDILDRISDDHPRLDSVLYPLVAQHFDINYGVLVKHKRTQLLESMAAILKNPWFERVWTIQEVAFGRKCVIVHGESNVDWESFCRAYMAEPNLRKSNRSTEDLVLPRWRLYLSLRGSSIQSIPPTRFQGSGQMEFELGLLAQIRNMKATVPHDKIYSLYSMFQVMGISLPDPDYEKDVAAVFQAVTLSYIRSRQNLDIITLIRPADESSGLPSWVPDWLTPGRNSASLIWKISVENTRRSPVTPLLTENVGDGKLGVMGKTVGKIRKRINCPLFGNSSLTKDEVYREFLSACLDWRGLIDSMTAYPSGKDPKQIERVLLRPYHAQVPDSPLRAWFRWAMHEDDMPSSIDDTTLDYIMEKRKTMKGNHIIFALDTGYIGTAPHSCQITDEVSLLSSLNPLVLRPQKEPRQFRIVTPAYCEGAMNGEIDALSQELEEFILV